MRDSALAIEGRARGPVGQLALRGRMTLHDLPLVLRELRRAIDDAPRRAAVCDVSDLSADLPTSLLAVFPTVLRHCGGWPWVGLHLSSPNPELDAVLDTWRMPRYVPVHADHEEAVAVARAESLTACRGMVLPADPASLTTLRSAFARWWPAPATGGWTDALAVTDELATNVIRHVARPFTVAVGFSTRHTVVAVTDSGPPPPVPDGAWPDRDRESGLGVVSELSRDWGVRLVHPAGKTVWAALPAVLPYVPVPRTPV